MGLSQQIFQLFSSAARFGHSTIFKREYTIWKKPSLTTDLMLLGNSSYLLTYNVLDEV
jgi:hypothetical protein